MATKIMRWYQQAGSVDYSQAFFVFCRAFAQEVSGRRRGGAGHFNMCAETTNPYSGKI